ncbi:MAG: EamA family transporter [Bacteroidales bacterium]|nr:EamA family transporter [Bacteroidales bacterium]
MLKLIILSLLQSLFLCGGQILLKLGLARSGPFSWTWSFFRSQLTNWWFLFCGIAFGLASVLWLYLLKHYSFSIVYPLTCISYLFGMFAAILVFKESVSALQWIGVLLIMTGCAFILK